MVDTRKLVERCAKGHKFTEENTGWKKGSTPAPVRFCRKCKKAADAAYRERAKDKIAQYRKDNAQKHVDYWREWSRKKRASMTVEEKRQHYAERHARESGIEMAKKDPLQYLKLEPDAAKLSDELNFQVDRVDEVDRSRPKCEGNPGPYMDYPEDRPPTVVQAMKLCYGCPILEQCAAYGAKLNEGDNQADGVWGGEVYKNGEKLYG